MYVCICHGITDHAIRDAVRAGASSLDDLRATLGVATQCGKCAPLVEDVLAETLSERGGEHKPNTLSVAA